MIPDSIMAHPGLSPTAKLAYGYLARCAGKNGECFPSVARIASAIRISPRQATRVIRELESAELLRQFARVDRKGQRSNAYQFLWQDILSASYPHPPDKYDTPGVSEMSPIREQVEEKTVEEHDSEHQPAFSAEPSPQSGEGAGCDGSILRAEWHRVHRRHQPAAAPPTDGQIRVLREMASAAAQRPVDDAELINLIRTTGTPKRRVQAYAWWQTAIANRLLDIRSGYERYRPEHGAHSTPVTSPTTSTFASFLDYEDLPKRVM